MYILDSISEKKQALYDEKNASPFKKGERVFVKSSLIEKYPRDKDREIGVIILDINEEDHTLTVKQAEEHHTSKHIIKQADVSNRDLYRIGENPFDEKFDSIRVVAFQLESIILSLDLAGDRRDQPILMSGIEIKELNWNPFVYNKKGVKEYYQRDFCWSLKDKQLLIESIYNRIDCGKILVRLRSWSTLERLAASGETELGFKDIVDGKQRMEAIKGFILNEYCDMSGNYYSDLSKAAQNKFGNHQLFSYAEMPENTTDEEVIYQFLKMNFTGVPQSQEHLDFVKEIQDKM